MSREHALSVAAQIRILKPHEKLSCAAGILKDPRCLPHHRQMAISIVESALLDLRVAELMSKPAPESENAKGKPK